MRKSSIGSSASRFPWLGSRRGSRWAAVAATVVGVTLLVGGAVHAAPPTVIDHVPYPISQPGSYVLAGNLLASSGPAITINASNVDLNGAGFTLDGQRTVPTGILVGAVSGVRIRNVAVTGFQFGIFLEAGSSNILLAGNTASGNINTGIVVEGSSSTLIGNTASHNDDFGIEVVGSNNLVTGNTADDNGERGIDLGSDATGNRVQANTASSNGSYGIVVDAGASGNRIQGNTAFSNGFKDLADDNGDCASNTWLGNRFGTANPSCIR